MFTERYNLIVDWIMGRTSEDKVKCIRWTTFSYLEELDYVDDFMLCSYT